MKGIKLLYKPTLYMLFVHIAVFNDDW